MSQITIAVQKREGAGKGVARKLRAQGLIPGVLYGRDSTPILFSASEKELSALLKEHGTNVIFSLQIDGKDYTCMLADYQKEIYQRFLTHVDFKLIDMQSTVTVKLPIRLQGDQEVRAKGGIAQLYLRHLTVKVKATEIPKSFSLDISHLKPGESLKLGSVATPENLTRVDADSVTVVNVLAPRALAAARGGK